MKIGSSDRCRELKNQPYIWQKFGAERVSCISHFTRKFYNSLITGGFACKCQNWKNFISKKKISKFWLKNIWAINVNNFDFRYFLLNKNIFNGSRKISFPFLIEFLNRQLLKSSKRSAIWYRNSGKVKIFIILLIRKLLFRSIRTF